MRVNRNQTNMTVITNANKAQRIANTLKRKNRLQTVIEYKNYKRNAIEYYIFYYNYR